MPVARDYLRLTIADPAADSNQQYLRALQRHCKAHAGLLLILDNVPDPRLLNTDGLPGAPPGFSVLSLACNLLFTTRRAFQLTGVLTHALAPLTPDASYQLLTSQRPPQGSGEQESAAAIYNAVGHLPLALTQAG